MSCVRTIRVVRIGPSGAYCTHVFSSFTKSSPSGDVMSEAFAGPEFCRIRNRLERMRMKTTWTRPLPYAYSSAANQDGGEIAETCRSPISPAVCGLNIDQLTITPETSTGLLYEDIGADPADSFGGRHCRAMGGRRFVAVVWLTMSDGAPP